MSGMRIATEEDLQRCAQEPIHVPGAVQPHGMLLALDEADLMVRQVSANIDRFLPMSAEDALGRPLAALIGREGAALVADKLNLFHLQEANPLPLRLGDAEVDGILHRQPGLVVLEIEPRQAMAESREALLGRAVSRLQAVAGIEELQDAAAHRIRDLTGYDRVMIYRFDPDGHGSVVAESLAAGLDPYLGLNYPASDIPAQARELYLRNWLRIIPNAGYDPVPLRPALRPDTGEALDLSFSTLRSVSRVHREYLINFGARASMSISLRRGKTLWGLISCINRSPRQVPYELRTACETIGRLVSLQIQAFEELQEREEWESRQELLTELVGAMNAAGQQVLPGLRKDPDSLLLATQSSGAAIVMGEELLTVGACPSDDAIRAVRDWAQPRLRSEASCHSRNLAAEIPGAADFAGEASGVLAVGLPEPSSLLLWFRPEVVRTVGWGGDPRHKATVEEDRLHPRHSFELWKEEVRGQALRWSKTDLRAAREIRRSAIEIDLRRRLGVQGLPAAAET